MALSGQLGAAGMTAESIDTKASLTLEKTDAGFTITAIHLDVTVKIPGADKAKFDEAAQNAKKGCPVSRVLNAKITMDAHLMPKIADHKSKRGPRLRRPSNVKTAYLVLVPYVAARSRP